MKQGRLPVIRMALAISLCILTGCTSFTQRDVRSRAVPETQGSVQAADNTSVAAALDTVLKLPVLGQIDRTNAESESVEVLPVLREPLAVDTCQYELEIHKDTGRVFVVKRGGLADHLHSRLGPWAVNDQPVEQLLSLIHERDSSGSPTW